MDTYEIRRQAIAAVAKLAIFAGMAGCGTSVVIADAEVVPPEPFDAGIDAERDPPEPFDAGVDAPIVPNPELACFQPEADQIPCCVDVLQTAFADDHLYLDSTTATEDEKACCELAVSTTDAWMGVGEMPFVGTYFSCCSTQLVSNAFEDHPSCSPWGPPMPPAMPKAAPAFGNDQVLA